MQAPSAAVCTQAPVDLISAQSWAPLSVSQGFCTKLLTAVQALIAGGTFNGQLCIWDLGRPGDPQLSTSSISEAAHQ